MARFVPGLTVAVTVLIFTTACRGRQSSLDPAGTYAEKIAGLYWNFFWVSVAVWLLVVLALFWAAFRPESRRTPSVRTATIVVGASTGVTILVLFVLLFSSAVTGNALSASDTEPAVHVEITAQQWWWDVVYTDPADPSRRFRTANELVVPVGLPVELKLRSTDVIHSFWIPNVHGKRDIIPGSTSRFVIEASRAGRFEGQCAEFCGLQHANMRLSYRALEPGAFRAWVEHQRSPAQQPSSPLEAKGRDVFLAAACPLCHTVSGTAARATVGPDLTHLAARPKIAAGTIPNTAGHLAGWITDPQTIKPGNRMPANALPPDDLQALLAYLGSLR